MGDAHTQALWRLSEAAKARAKHLITEHAIYCDLRSWIIHVAHRARLEPHYRSPVAYLHDRYSYQSVRFLDKLAARDLVRSEDVKCAMLDEDPAHLHPLNFAQGVAAAVERAGAHIFAKSLVPAVNRSKDHVTVETPGATFKAQRVGWSVTAISMAFIHVRTGVCSHSTASLLLPNLWARRVPPN